MPSPAPQWRYIVQYTDVSGASIWAAQLWDGVRQRSSCLKICSPLCPKLSRSTSTPLTSSGQLHSAIAIHIVVEGGTVRLSSVPEMSESLSEQRVIPKIIIYIFTVVCLLKKWRSNISQKQDSDSTLLISMYQVTVKRQVAVILLCRVWRSISNFCCNRLLSSWSSSDIAVNVNK